jgi:hypothetical protein
MEQAADQLLLEYLARVGAEAQSRLPSRRRTQYIAEVRQRIEKERDKAKVRSAADMKRLLDRFGPADRLVAADLDSGVGRGDGKADDDTSASSRATKAQRRKLGVLARPVSYKRAPPPWKGGPRQTRLYRRNEQDPAQPPAEPPSGAAPVEGVLGRFSPGVIFVRVLHGARSHPTAVGAALLYLVTGLIGWLTVLWPIAAAQVAFGRPWRRVDKWLGLGVPTAATIVGMALWQGEAAHIDLVIQESFVATGIWGLRAAVVACGFLLLLRMSRIVAEERVRAGHFPVTGDTPLGPSLGKAPEKGD